MCSELPFQNQRAADCHEVIRAAGRETQVKISRRADGQRQAAAESKRADGAIRARINAGACAHDGGTTGWGVDRAATTALESLAGETK